MATTGPIVVVGGGLAAATCCGTLRELGYDGGLVLIGAEPHLPYERPPLSKGYLMGADELDSVFVHPGEWYDEHDVTVTGSTSDVPTGRPISTYACARRRRASTSRTGR